MSDGAIAGIVAGGVAAASIGAGALYFFFKGKRSVESIESYDQNQSGKELDL